MTTVWTFGHSTRAPDEFLAALRAHGLEALADVRRFPASRRNPQFGTDELKKLLHRAGIRYLYLGDELGGFRKTGPDSPNVGLGNSSFRGYADWTASPRFRDGVAQLLEAAQARATVVMCAERPVSNCHRGILGDFLELVHGIEVVDIYDAAKATRHRVTAGAKRVGDGVLYDLPRGATRIESFADEPPRDS